MSDDERTERIDLTPASKPTSGKSTGSSAAEAARTAETGTPADPSADQAETQRIETDPPRLSRTTVPRTASSARSSVPRTPVTAGSGTPAAGTAAPHTTTEDRMDTERVAAPVTGTTTAATADWTAQATTAPERQTSGSGSTAAPAPAVWSATTTEARGVRVGTVVWGLVIAAIGVGLLAFASGVTFDVELALIGLVAAAGVALLVGSLVTGMKRRRR